MTQEAILYNQITTLPAHLREEVSHFVQFLMMHHVAAQPGQPHKNARKAGFSSVEFTMSDDFDAPLEDFKEYME